MAEVAGLQGRLVQRVLRWLPAQLVGVEVCQAHPLAAGPVCLQLPAGLQLPERAQWASRGCNRQGQALLCWHLHRCGRICRGSAPGGWRLQLEPARRLGWLWPPERP